MANLSALDSTGATVQISATGTGSGVDPFVVAHAISGTVAVTGPLTDAELRATAVPVSLAANQSVNVAQVGGANTQTNNGVSGAGVQRVTIASDSTGVPTALVDNNAFTDGATRIPIVGGVFDEVAGTALTENDGAAMRIDSKRALIGVIEDATTRGQRVAVSAAGRLSVDASGVAVPVTDNSGSLTVDGTITANAGTGFPAVATDGSAAPTTGIAVMGIDGSGNSQNISTNTAGVVNVNVNSISAGTTNIGDVDVLTVPAPLSTTGGGTEATALRVTIATDSTGVLSVDDNGASITVDGTVAISSLPASTNTIEVVGDAAHDAAIAGNPVRTGGRARSSTLTAVANDDTTDFIADLNGKQIVLPYANPENFISGSVSAAMTGTTDTAVIAAQGAGIRIYVTQITITNDHATVGTVVNIKDGTTTLYKVFAAAAGGGATITLPTPLRLTANTALNAANVTTGSSVYVSAAGYTAP